MNGELASELRNAKDVGDVVNAVSKLSKCYGDIRRWKFFRQPGRDVLRFFIQLDRPEFHPDLARELGGEVQGEEVSFEVRFTSMLTDRAQLKQ
jgi:hypothetical protein